MQEVQAILHFLKEDGGLVGALLLFIILMVRGDIRLKREVDAVVKENEWLKELWYYTFGGKEAPPQPPKGRGRKG